MISTRTAATNESQAGPQPRGPLIIKPRNIQTQKLMSWQRDQNRLRLRSTTLGRKATKTTLGVRRRDRTFILSEHLQLLTGQLCWWELRGYLFGGLGDRAAAHRGQNMWATKD